jgi:hypothetical protein
MGPSRAGRGEAVCVAGDHDISAETTFDATSDTLANLLNEVASGHLQLPDFERGWVWDDERIAAVITGVARSFPIGAVMTLQTGGEVGFKARPVEGAVFPGEPPQPECLILEWAAAADLKGNADSLAANVGTWWFIQP